MKQRQRRCPHCDHSARWPSWNCTGYVGDPHVHINIDTETHTITKPGLFPPIPWGNTEPTIIESISYVLNEVLQYFSRRRYWRRRKYYREAADSGEVSWLLE
ncbi:MAG: hypothetical protein QOJ23_2311 [Actinomycetota bacterium]|nr:hypothetical protein [Actinomycetota bacterium]